MPNTNPTIVQASLDDKELQASINKMVANFDKGLQTMLDHTNTKVKEINEALKGIGNVNFGATGSNDGGVAKRTKAQEEYTESVKKTTAETKRMGKETEMTFDQIATTLSQARRTVSDFNTKRASGMLPGSEDYKKYEQALARIVEYNDKLKQSALGMADANQKAFAFDGKGLVKDFFSIDERLKQLNQHYKEEEKSSQKATAAIKENTQAKKENANVGQPAKSARDSYIAFMQGYKQQAEQIRSLMEEEQKAMQQRRQGVVDGFTKTIEERKARVKELSEEIAKLYKERPDGYRDAIKQRTEEMNALKQKIRELTEAQKNLADSPIGASNRFLELEKEYYRLKNMLIDTTNTQRQSANETERQTQSTQQQESTVKNIVASERDLVEEEKRRLALIREIATEARESMSKHGNSAYLTPYRSESGAAYIYAENDARAKGLTIEQQIANILRENDALYQASARSASMVVEEEKKITQEQDKRKSYKAPVTTINDSFKQLTANALGVNPSEIDSTSTRIAKMTTYVRQLETAYSNLTRTERESPFGMQLRQQIQQVSRDIQKARSEISRPINLQDAFSYAESTLDDIAHKMRRLASYRSGLDVNTQKSEIDQVNRKYTELQKKMDEVMAKNSKMASSNNILANSWRYMRNRLAFYFTVGASTQFIKNLIEVRSQYEMNEKALGILINSAERGTQIFNELSQMALVSPYTLIELSTAAKQLAAYDIAAKDVVDTTRRLADISAAVGVPVERFTYALGQVKAFGHLTSQDARQFLNTGVPLVKELAKHYTELEGRLVSTADVYDRMKKHAVSYNDVVLVLNEMTDEGGKFFDYQAKMAETLKVQLANLTLAWNNMLNDIGSQTQGILSTGISGLKELFLHWQTLDRILNNVAITLGTAKAAQMLLNLTFGKGTLEVIKNTAALKGATAANFQYAIAKANIGKAEAKLLVSLYRNNAALKEAIFNLKLLSAEEINAASKATLLGHNLGFVGMAGKRAMLGLVAVSKAAWVGVKMLSSSLLSLFTNPAFVALAATMAITDAIMYANQLDDKMKEMNQNIANGAKEAAKSMGDFLKESVMISNRQKALNNLLSAEDGEKAWNALREQIELSSDASDIFISKLLLEEDINKRVAEGFAVADKIREATEAMSAIDEEALKVSQDSWLFGAFGEGLGEDLEDYIEMIKGFREEAASRGLGSNAIKMWAADTQNKNEVEEEMRKLADDVAQVLRDRLGEGISDPVKIREALERLKKEIKASNPQIKGEVANFFDVNLEELLKPQFRALNEGTTALQQQFLQILKRDYSSAFADITDDIFKKNARWGKDQEDTIKKAAEKFKTITVPEFHSAIDEMVRDMNSRDWRIRIATTMGTVERSDFQKDWDTRFAGKGAGIYDAYRPKDGIDLPTYAKEQRDAIKKLKVEEASYTKDSSAYSTKRRQKAEDEIRVRTELLKAYNQPLEEKSTPKGGRTSQKDILGDALAKEVQLIGEIQKRYKEYQQMGVKAQEAVTLATEEYGNTLKRTNATLAKYGIATKSSDELASMNIREIRDYYKTLLEGAKNKDNAKGIEAIEKALASINVEITKLDYKKITDGLNNELDKLKDEYELAVELDANPEFGGVFADMFGINMETLPRTAKEYAERATKEINKYLSEKKSDIKIGNLLYLTDDDLRMFQERVETDGLSQEWVDNITKAAKDVRDVWKKETSNTIKNWNSLVEKYGEIQAKITKINKDSSAQLKDIVMQYGSDEQKSLVTRLYDNLSKEQNPQEIEKLRKQIEDIVSKISENNPIALKIQVAIGNANKRQISQELWEYFKNGDLYTSTFEDMERVSTFTIKRILDELERLKNKVKDDPASMKALMKSMDDARKKLQERNPFKTLLESIKKLEGKRTAVKNAKTALDNAKKALDDAKEQDNQEEVQRNIKKVEEAEKVLSQTSDELTASLQELKKAQEGVSSAMQSLAGIISTTSDIAKALGGSDDSVETLNDLAESINGVTEAAEGITDIVTGAESGNILTIIQGAQKTIEGTWKTIDTWLDNSDKRRTRSIERSQMAIKHLELAYIDLQHAVDKAYGMATIGAQKAAIANKELQLVELKRQLALEQGRKKKYRDNARIMELQQQIKELQYEIQDATDSIVNDLLGISSVGDAMENLMDGLIDALRSGEDAMAVFDENIDNMIANMMKKMYVTKVLQPWFENVWEQIQKDIDKRGGDAAKLAQEQLSLDDNQLRMQMVNSRVFDFLEKLRREGFTGFFPSFRKMQEFVAQGITDEDLKAFRKDAQRRLTEATSPTMEDLMNYAELLREGRPVIENGITGLNEALKQLGIDKESLELSSLQQGIQGITEDTAGALEAITNGISQQCYLQSDILIQIRDTVQSFDIDIQTASLSQILLQLQSSYQLQQSMLLTMENWTNPSGNAVRVELMS